jgi:hypothetical protein
MDLYADWADIKRVFEAGIASSKHCAIASVDPDGRPRITPIGFVFLGEEPSAFYFEQYARGLARNLGHDRRLCLMVVQSGLLFWLRSLQRARFASLPGVRLYGEAGELRAATSEELARLERRIGPAKHLPGAKLIWSGLEAVRDVRLTAVEPVVYPHMMEHLLGAPTSSR